MIASSGPQPGPLSGLRIVELSSYVAAPLCGLVLSQLGADVVRVEPLGGAPDRGRMPRSTEGTSLYWSGLNGGKRDLAVDMHSSQGRRLVADLICGHGAHDDPGGAIVISNGRRYEDLSYAALSARRPDLVHVQLDGTRDGRNAVDYLVQASTGFAALTGPAGSRVPTNTVVPSWDIAAGLYLATGLLAAVHERRNTGRGQQVELALEDVAYAAAGAMGYLAEAQLQGIDRTPAGNEVFGTFGRDFVSGDGVRFMMVVLTTQQWRRLVDVTGLGDVFQAIETALDADLSEESERYQHRGVIAGLLTSWVVQRTWKETSAALTPTGVLLEPYRTFNDLVADDAAVLRQHSLFAEVDQPGAGRYLAPGSPLVMGGRFAAPRSAPELGDHTDAILADVGILPDRIEELRDAGLVA
jgi:2-methylfumaryl-CoA isomerase